MRVRRASGSAGPAACRVVLNAVAILDELDRLGARRVAVAAPYYSPEWKAMFTEFLRHGDYRIEAFQTFVEQGLFPDQASVERPALPVQRGRGPGQPAPDPGCRACRGGDDHRRHRHPHGALVDRSRTRTRLAAGAGRLVAVPGSRTSVRAACPRPESVAALHQRSPAVCGSIPAGSNVTQSRAATPRAP